MKLLYEFESIELDGEVVEVPVGENSINLNYIIRTNKSGKEIIELLANNDLTIDEIVDTIAQKYSNDYTSIRAYVDGFISHLKENGLVTG